MSNVELVRRFWTLWDDARLAELVARYDEFFTEDLEWRSPVTAVSGAWLTGREEFDGHVVELLRSFDEIGTKPEEITETAPDVVVSRVHIHGRGVASGAVIDAPLLAIVRMRAGRIRWSWASFDLHEGARMVDQVVSGKAPVAE
jgi:ketosteroid isomerase-like protein